jgi:hypothetical protein
MAKTIVHVSGHRYLLDHGQGHQNPGQDHGQGHQNPGQELVRIMARVKAKSCSGFGMEIFVTVSGGAGPVELRITVRVVHMCS